MPPPPFLPHPPSTLSSLDDYRIFCGDLAPEVRDEDLQKAFSHYQSLVKSRVIRDPKSKKSKGYGFVSFKEGKDFIKALKEMNGTRASCGGSRPWQRSATVGRPVSRSAPPFPRPLNPCSFPQASTLAGAPSS